MKHALIALDPEPKRGKGFARFCAIVRLFEQKGILSPISAASVIHSALYPVPYAWYRKMRAKYARETLDSISLACGSAFKLDSAKVLFSDSHDLETLVSRISRYSRRAKADLLVVASTNRTGLPQWFLGSFSETAALTATLPVLIIKPNLDPSSFSTVVRFVVGVDVSAPPSAKQVRWIADFARKTKVHVDLVYVQPRSRVLLSQIEDVKEDHSRVKSVLENLSQSLRKVGVPSTEVRIPETKTIAHALAEYADARQAWLTILTNPRRSQARRILLGSTARRFLGLSERPFLSLRDVVE